MSVADWTCKSLKPILRRGGSAHQIIASVTPKIPIPKSHRLALGVAQTVEDFRGAPGRGGGLSWVNHGDSASTVLQRASTVLQTVLQPFNQPHYTHGFHHGIAAKSIHLSQKSKNTSPEIHNFVHARPLPISDTTTPHSVSESEFGSGRACGALGAEATCKPQSGQDRVLNPDTTNPTNQQRKYIHINICFQPPIYVHFLDFQIYSELRICSGLKIKNAI